MTDYIQIALMAILVGTTIFYAYQAKKANDSAKASAQASAKMAEEMKEQRYDAVRPIIDIVNTRMEPMELAKQVYGAKEGKFPNGLPCMLRNIGVGPAIEVYSFIEDAEGKPRRWDFGAIPVAIGEEVNRYTREIREEEVEYTREARLFIQQRGEHRTLVVCYKDIFDNPFESSREVSVDKERTRLEIGPLKIPKLPKEEYSDD